MALLCHTLHMYHLVMERQYFKYSHESMIAAIKEVREGHMSRHAASKAYDIPRSTLCDKLDGKSPDLEDRKLQSLQF